MKTSLTFLALAASALASPRPDAVTSAISPSSSAPAGCMSTVPGNFETQIVNVTKSTKRETPLEQRDVACGGTGTLVLTLQNGVLMDAINRTGYIAANRQFQFDGPPQAGAKITAGWSICGNQSLSLGGSAIFYQCLSGTFYNLYDQSQGGQCSQVTIQTVACVGGTAPASGSMSSSAMTSSTIMSSMSGMSSAAMTSASSSAMVTYIPAPPVTVVTTYSNGTSSAAAVMSGASAGLQTASTASAASTASSATAVVKQSSDGQPQATTTASAGPAVSTGKGSVLAVGKEVLALAAGVAAVFAF